MYSEEEIKQALKEEWPNLEVVGRLGNGAFGSVYECQFKDRQGLYAEKQAVKVISIPVDEYDVPEAGSGVTKAAHFKNQCDEALDEVRRMDELRAPHVIHLNDHAVHPMPNNGYLILIRMDLMKSLSSQIEAYMEKMDEAVAKGKKLTPEYEASVVREVTEGSAASPEEWAILVASHISEALYNCKNIIHRDIKPQNILYLKNNYYLGDFGIARVMENGQSARSRAGTDEYMAFEVSTEGKKYDQRADIFSLGLVLYRILNHNRAPFISRYPEPFYIPQRRESRTRLQSGEAIPIPDNCSGEFGEIVRKMCAADPDQRFASAEEVLSEIQNMKYRRKNSDVVKKEKPVEPALKPQKKAEQPKKAEAVQSKVVPVQPKPEAPKKKEPVQTKPEIPKKKEPVQPKSEKPKKQNLLLPIIVAVVLAAGAGFAGASVLGKVNAKETEAQTIEKVIENTAENTEEVIETAAVQETENESKPQSKSEFIADMQMVSGDGDHQDFRTNSLGQEYKKGLHIATWSEKAYQTYYLGGKYTRLKGTYSCSGKDYVNSKAKGIFTILKDESQEIEYEDEITQIMGPREFDIDVTGWEFVTFQMENKDPGAFMGMIIGDCTVSDQDASAAASDSAKETKTSTNSPVKPTYIADMRMVSGDGDHMDFYTNSLGQEYKKGLHIATWSEKAYQTYYLGGKYTKLKGSYSCSGKDYINSEAKGIFTILRDESQEKEYEDEIVQIMGPKEFDIDVTGWEFVTFQMDNDTPGSFMGMIVGDCTAE